MVKKTATALSTKTALLVIAGLAAAGALAYAGISISRNTQNTKDCMNSCLEYQVTDPEYVGVCQQSCQSGEAIIYDNADVQEADTLDTTDATGGTEDVVVPDDSTVPATDGTIADQAAQ